EGYRAANQRPDGAAHRAEDEPPQRLRIRRRDQGEAVRRHPQRRKCAMVATEHRNVADDVVPRVAHEPDTPENRADPLEKRRLVRGIPDHHAVADAAQLQAQDPRELVDVDLPYVVAGAEKAALLRRAEEKPQAELSGRRGAESLDQAQEEA